LRTTICAFSLRKNQGMLKVGVSLYHWPPVWLVWISLFCKQKQKLSVAMQLIPKPVKQEVNGTVILTPLAFPGPTIASTVECQFFKPHNTQHSNKNVPLDRFSGIRVVPFPSWQEFEIICDNWTLHFTPISLRWHYLSRVTSCTTDLFCRVVVSSLGW
jgi:hypothetical protein